MVINYKTLEYPVILLAMEFSVSCCSIENSTPTPTTICNLMMWNLYNNENTHSRVSAKFVNIIFIHAFALTLFEICWTLWCSACVRLLLCMLCHARDDQRQAHHTLTVFVCVCVSNRKSTFNIMHVTRQQRQWRWQTNIEPETHTHTHTRNNDARHASHLIS